jgi:hypothetical protein
MYENYGRGTREGKGEDKKNKTNKIKKQENQDIVTQENPMFSKQKY